MESAAKQGFLKVLLLLTGLATMGYLIMPYINNNNMKELSIILASLLSGLVVASFAYGTVYVDSLNPGVTSPAPFSTDPNGRAQQQLCFVGAIASGAIVTLIMYVNS